MSRSPEYAELEISLNRRDTESYNVELRFDQPNSDASVRPSIRDLRALHIDQSALLAAKDAAAYGHELAQRLFVEAGIGEALAQARAVVESQSIALRIRLFIAPDVPELHNIRWETISDPTGSTALLMNENIVFSRYLSGLDFRPVLLRPQSALRALLVIANPKDVKTWGLDKLQLEEEWSTASSGLGDIAYTELVRQQESQSGVATLDNLMDHLRDEVDILYLIAHGKLVDGEPTLYLEDDKGDTLPVAGQEFINRVRDLATRPRLVVLVSCQSAGDGSVLPSSQDNGALAGLGPRRSRHSGHHCHARQHHDGDSPHLYACLS